MQCTLELPGHFSRDIVLALILLPTIGCLYILYNNKIQLFRANDLKETLGYKKQITHINIAHLGQALVEDTPPGAPPNMDSLIFFNMDS